MKMLGKVEVDETVDYPTTEYYVAVDVVEGARRTIGVRISAPRQTLLEANADLAQLKPLFPQSRVVGCTTFF